MLLPALVVFAFAALIVQSTLTAVLPFEFPAPNLLLPIVMYLGVAPQIEIARGGFTAFVLGYLLDLFGGSPMGLHTFSLVAVFMAARGAGLSFFLRGPLYQLVLTFGITLLDSLTIISLRAIFEEPEPFPAHDFGSFTRRIVVSAALTALVAPGIFWIITRVDSFTSKRAARLREGPR